MSSQKTSVFVTALLTLSVIVMAIVMYVQLSEIRKLREDIASLQQVSEADNQGLREELTSLRTEMAELDSSEELATIQQSIRRLRLQGLGIVIDQPIASLQPDIDFWWEQYPDTVRTITRGDYGAEWPFETDDVLLGCHGGDVIAVVYGGDFMVDSASPGLHSFMPDIADISVFDASSLELATARDRMIEEAQGLCHGKVVR